MPVLACDSQAALAIFDEYYELVLKKPRYHTWMGKGRLYPPSRGAPARQTLNPGVHLDLNAPGVPRERACADGADDADGFGRDAPHGLIYDSLRDFRAEINAVAAERGGPHHQGVLNLVDNETDDGGTSVVPKFHAHFDAWRVALGAWKKNRTCQRRRGRAFVFAADDPIHALQARCHCLRRVM